jgi:VWFA-related protein
MRRASCILAAGLALGLWLGRPAPLRADARPAQESQLDPKYREWLEEVAPLLTKEERKQFLALTKDYQRDGFIYRFWESRNPYPGASFNAFKAEWQGRVQAVREEYGNLTEDRARIKLLNGAPAAVYKTNCGREMWTTEIWTYRGTGNAQSEVVLIFIQPNDSGSFHLWHASDGLKALIAMFNPDANLMRDDFSSFIRWAKLYCAAEFETLVGAVNRAANVDRMHLSDALYAAPRPHDPEWLAAFRGVSTDLPPGAPPLPAKVEVAFPARDQGRTVLQGQVLVAATAALPADLQGHRSYGFLLTGELLHGSELAESFRYEFDLPAGAPGPTGATLPLAFERRLWPGDYVLILRVEDLHSHHNFRDERPLTVPSPAGLPEVGAVHQPPAVTAVLDRARAELAAGGRPGAGDEGQPATPGTGRPAATAGAAMPAAIRLVPPPGEQQTGALRVAAEVSGDGIRKVSFVLDGKLMLTRVRPPYSVELQLGAVPVARQVAAIAYGADGRELARDELTLNAPRQRFAVRLIEPRSGGSYRGALVARAEVRVPDGASLDRLELFLDSQWVATLYQPPYTLKVPLAAPAVGRGGRFVRVVAYLADGSAAEDLAVINSAEEVERLDVRLVELYATVLDRGGRPVGGLGEHDFQVREGGEPQSLLRCEPVHDLPLRLLLALDTSASMAASLPEAQRAAVAFLANTFGPADRAAVLSFSDTPVLRLPLSGDRAALGGALAGLHAERGTALWDSLVYGLSYLKGIERGQPAVVLFTDGGDHLSRLRFEEALEFARRSGIAIYAIGFQVSHLAVGDRGRLAKLAEETGGKSFFVASAAELDSAYATIAEDLRSRYLLAYQPSRPPHAGEWRPVEIKVTGDGRRVKSIRGYSP